MQVMILCGLGTRLREETEYRPKPMVDIGGRPDELEPAVYTTIGWTRKK